MRRSSLSIIKATALEVLSEPLSLLVLLAALVLTVLAPAFHYHQFGEATRMARDAGLSSVLMGGLVVAVFGTIRAFRREVESGTMAMALAHPVSRTEFFLAKTLGAGAAYLVFASIVFLTALVIVDGAAIGGLIAAIVYMILLFTDHADNFWGGLCQGITFGMMIVGVIMTSKYAAKVRAYKMKMLHKE